MHGIQFFPVGTALFPVLDANVLDALVDPVAKSAGNNIWKSNLLLVSAVRTPKASAPVLRGDFPIDPGYSQSYVAHWVKALEELGAFVPDVRVGTCMGSVFRKSTSLTAVVYRFPSDPVDCTVTDRASGRSMTLRGLTPGWNILPVHGLR